MSSRSQTCPWYFLIKSLNRACPNAKSLVPIGLAADARGALSVSGMVECTLTGNDLLLGLVTGEGRARDAVEDNVGLAREDDTTAGTEVDLIPAEEGRVVGGVYDDEDFQSFVLTKGDLAFVVRNTGVAGFFDPASFVADGC